MNRALIVLVTAHFTDIKQMNCVHNICCKLIDIVNEKITSKFIID